VTARRTARIVRVALGIAMLSVVVAVALDGGGIRAVAGPLASAGGWTVALTVPLALSGLVLQAIQYRAIHRSAGSRDPGLAELLRDAASTLLGNLMLPAAGTVGRIELAHRRDGASRSKLVAGSAVQYASLAVMAIASVAVLAGGRPTWQAWAAVAAVPALAAVSAPLAGPIGGPSPLLAFRVAAVEMLRLGLTSVRLLVLLHLFTGSLDLGTASMTAAGSALAHVIPLVPAGLGVREALMTLAGAVRGADPASVAAVAVVDRLVTTSVAAIVVATGRAVMPRPGSGTAG
jgi:uncharacterized membrane protein YbhN (UPF0104 family)